MKTFERPPSLMPSYFRALAKKGSNPDNATVPRLECALEAWRAPPETLRKYRRLCGFADAALLPPTWPQVIAAPLQVVLVTDPAFPFPALGLVHVRQRIDVLRRIEADEPLHLEAHVEGHRVVAHGAEVDLVSQARTHGEVVWRSVTTALSRGKPVKSATSKTKGQKLLPEPLPPQPGLVRSITVKVPADIGRRYAAIAGDWNPIHVSAWAAKPFGFPRAIAHGMWTLARSLAESADELPPPPFRVDARFRKPVLLPSTVAVEVWREADAIGMHMVGRDHATLHLDASAQPLHSVDQP
jgi:acyl dehydratase